MCNKPHPYRYRVEIAIIQTKEPLSIWSDGME